MRLFSYSTSLVVHLAVLGGLYSAGTMLPTYTIQEGRATVELMASMASRAEPEEMTKPIEILTRDPVPSESSPAPFELAQTAAVPVTKDARRHIEPILERPVPTSNIEPTRPSEELAMAIEVMEFERKQREPEVEKTSVDAEATPFSQANDGGEVDELPRPLANRKVPYPADALRDRLEGRVILAVWVAADGSATCVTVETSSGHKILDQTALNMVRSWRFAPARRGGKAVPFEVFMPVNFSIPGE